MFKRIALAIACVAAFSVLLGCGTAPKAKSTELHSGASTFVGVRSIATGPGGGAKIKTEIVLSLNDNTVKGVSDAPFEGTYEKTGNAYKIIAYGTIEKKQLRFKLIINATLDGGVLKGRFSQTFDEFSMNQDGGIELVAK